MTRLSIASNPNSQAHIEELFRRRAGSADVYMALANGPKSQEELTAILGKSQPTVSKIVAHLYESGLIDRVPQSRRVLWMWHDMERTLGISRVARRLATKPTPKAGAPNRTLRTFHLTDDVGLAQLFLAPSLPTKAQIAHHLRSRAVLLPPTITADFLANQIVAAFHSAKREASPSGDEAS